MFAKLSAKQELGALAVLSALVVLSLFVHLDTGANWFLWGPFFDAGHYPLFFLCTMVGLRAARFLPAHTPRFFRQPYALLAIFVVLVELVQPLFKRSASLVDVENGLLGIACAGLVYETFRRNTSGTTKALALLTAAALFIPLCLPLRGAFATISWRKAQFPVLARFQDAEEELLWGELEPREATLKDHSEIRFVRSAWLEDNTGLYVSTAPGYFAGTSYAAGDFDWSAFETLNISIVNPDKEAFTLYLRIDDATLASHRFEGRFNKAIQLEPGAQKIQITLKEIESGPKNRSLDVHTIRAVLLFVDSEDIARRFIIDEFYLAQGRS